ncbi:MAG: bifunctional folylpolyglutamate synthase/dihydrofolate synthase [Candidatus Galacturonibacter soehngenii]|uniref:tetrahydrofolate synthase n=1 Tax=Candidatus Galacturonatibacter soehngenii TaxID=2307010 RepID=A0A7V7UDP2_9FIRM|nr:bifunctional folylpolyglutamate synthase/dihydrofolate synthase [Candidatus Galacturonibacter soehngenii]MBA4687781.1 bifunctional folylpolyglutamate synthase/dihydrofolate synthase [Candidatus Galacturonibacter soehngenii]
MNYEEAVTYILNVPKFTKKNPVENIKALMTELNNPQRNTKVIHVAGTNGKGSVCAFIESILNESKKTNGMFTSPHLVKINERFRINGVVISDENFTDAFDQVIKAVDKIIKKGYSHPTFFEFLFAMSMVIFEKENVEFVILETGLGGRLDATNMIENPILTIITTVDLDHTEILGDTIEKIAFEKAGIIKPNVPVIFDGTNLEVNQIIEEVARKNEAKCYKLIDKENYTRIDDTNFWYELLEFNDKNIDFLFKYGYDGCIRVSLGMIGEYQVKNSSLAIKAVQLLEEEKFNERVILEGVKKATWPGRMEMLLPNVYLDGAHNENGIAEFIKTVKHFPNHKKVLLFSAVMEKSYTKMIQEICNELQFDQIVVTLLSNKRAVPLKVLQAEFEARTKSVVYAIDNVKEAFEKTLHLKTEEGIAFCVGSLYLVGEITEIVRRIEHDKF